jgi:4-hydroxy-tetrahydrodipicolinate reductase
VTDEGQGRIRVCVAGITGWTGRPVTEAIAAAPDLQLVSGVSRSVAGGTIADALQIDGADDPIFRTVDEALDAVPADALVDYTSAEAVKGNVLAAIQRGVCVVIGSSGLTADDYETIEALAIEHEVGVVAMANASIMAALLQRFALQAAEYLPSWEVIDYADATKIDVPSGTARQLAERLGDVRHPTGSRPIDELIGPHEARGASVQGTQVHSIRLPSYVVSTEIIFGQAGERLILRHEAGESAAPYVGGTLRAVREVVHRVGLLRGLDALLFA